jgi:hypothetical protein
MSPNRMRATVLSGQGVLVGGLVASETGGPPLVPKRPYEPLTRR